MNEEALLKLEGELMRLRLAAGELQELAKDLLDAAQLDITRFERAKETADEFETKYHDQLQTIQSLADGMDVLKRNLKEAIK